MFLTLLLPSRWIVSDVPDRAAAGQMDGRMFAAAVQMHCDVPDFTVAVHIDGDVPYLQT